MAKDVEQRVIDAAKDLFYYYGYSKVTLDEVAIKIGISKKTIYNHFASKKHVLKLVSENIKNQLEKKVEDIMADTKGEFVDKLKKCMIAIGVELSSIPPQFIDDLERSAPDVWKEVLDFKKKIAITHISKLIDEGNKNGYLLKGINRDMAVLTYVSAIEYLNSTSLKENLPKNLANRFSTSAKEVFGDVIDMLYEGILAENMRKKSKK